MQNTEIQINTQHLRNYLQMLRNILHCLQIYKKVLEGFGVNLHTFQEVKKFD